MASKNNFTATLSSQHECAVHVYHWGSIQEFVPSANVIKLVDTQSSTYTPDLYEIKQPKQA